MVTSTKEQQILFSACMYCQKIRNHIGDWIVVDDMSRLLFKHLYGEFDLSHTACLPCLIQELPACKSAAMNELTRMKKGEYILPQSMIQIQLAFLTRVAPK